MPAERPPPPFTSGLNPAPVAVAADLTPAGSFGSDPCGLGRRGSQLGDAAHPRRPAPVAEPGIGSWVFPSKKKMIC